MQILGLQRLNSECQMMRGQTEQTECNYVKAVSGALLVPWTQDVYWPARLCCVWPQHMEPTTNGLPITRTVAIFVQAPAQDPLVRSSTRQCWLQLWVSCTVVPSALLSLYSEFGADYKCPDSTRLEWIPIVGVAGSIQPDITGGTRSIIRRAPWSAGELALDTASRPVLALQP